MAARELDGAAPLILHRLHRRWGRRLDNRKAFATGVNEPTQQRAGDTGPLGGWTAPRGKELHLSSAVFCFL